MTQVTKYCFFLTLMVLSLGGVVYSQEITDLEDQIDLLNSLGYVGGSEEPTETSLVTIYDRKNAAPGYNFYFAGHAPEAILMDMEGTVRHRWHYDFVDLLAYLDREPEDVPETDMDRKVYLDRRHWGRAYLYPNGDILAMYENFALIKLDKNSQIIWANHSPFHHDFDVSDDGTIYALSSRERPDKSGDESLSVRDDLIVVLDANGKELKAVSLLDCIANAQVTSIQEILPRTGDLLHTNTVSILDDRLARKISAVKKGNLLVSFLMVNTIAVVNMETERVVWTLQGDFRFQHQPKVLENGNILLFDNFGPAMENISPPRSPMKYQAQWYRFLFKRESLPHRASAVIEIDPLSEQVLWSYRGNDSKPFSSDTCGTTHRLSNGNTLIVESQFGRGFEVMPSGEIVWEFVSPHRIDGKVARLFDMQRIDFLSVEAWLE